jgi:hypothetical protein
MQMREELFTSAIFFSAANVIFWDRLKLPLIVYFPSSLILLCWCTDFTRGFVLVCSFPVAVDDIGLGAFAASELDKVFSGYQ